MGRNHWSGHSHSYDRVIVESSKQVFETSRCASCGEHKLVTRFKKLLTRKK